ncbi:MAG TPA: hypothetical protein PKD37_01165 [Oligoflexia bacterium]|nr:hypothetical protein [Oligoflexia bacterium]HMP26587.1 hypothetical protein [Oligoflexia bacterium]
MRPQINQPRIEFNQEIGAYVRGKRTYPVVGLGDPVCIYDIYIERYDFHEAMGRSTPFEITSTTIFKNEEIEKNLATWHNWKDGLKANAGQYVLGQKKVGAFKIETTTGLIPVFVINKGAFQHLIPQRSYTSDMYASAAMILFDYCSKNNITSLDYQDLANQISGKNILLFEKFKECYLDKLLANTQCQAHFLRLSNDNELKDNLIKILCEYGSAILQIYSNELGNRFVAISYQEDEGQFLVRDPFHGWAIQVTYKNLSRYLALGAQIIYLDEADKQKQPSPESSLKLPNWRSFFRFFCS